MKRICGVLFLGLAVSATAAPQSEKKMAKAVAGQQLEYWLHVPEGEAPEAGWPVMMFLHGAGERGDDLAKVKVHGPPKLTAKVDQLKTSVVISPQCPKDSWWNSETLKALFDEVLAGLDGEGDTSRLYCTGLSMGGYGTWQLLMSYPEFLAAAAPICGGGDVMRLTARVNRDGSPKFELEKLKAAKGLPIWAFHGAADPVVPQAESELLVDALKSAGATKVKFTSYPGVGHNSWSRTYADPGFYEWLYSQKRG